MHAHSYFLWALSTLATKREVASVLAHPRKNKLASHYRPASETPFEWHFAYGPIVVRDCMLGCAVLVDHSFIYCNFGNFREGSIFVYASFIFAKLRENKTLVKWQDHSIVD